MGNSGMALSDPQGQPKHAEYHRVGYPHRCHWIIILKAIVQDSIISGILVAECDQMQGYKEYVLRSPLLHHSDTVMKALSLPHITHGPRWAIVGWLFRTLKANPSILNITRLAILIDVTGS